MGGTGVTTHKLKTWPGYYEAIVAGTKTFEVRNNDRCFKVGDKLELLEWRPTPGLFAESEPFGSAGSYTGRSTTQEIVYMMESGKGQHFGLYPGYAVLGIRPVQSKASEART
jgi:hypothetical protein